MVLFLVLCNKFTVNFPNSKANQSGFLLHPFYNGKHNKSIPILAQHFYLNIYGIVCAYIFFCWTLFYYRYDSCFVFISIFLILVLLFFIRLCIWYAACDLIIFLHLHFEIFKNRVLIMFLCHFHSIYTIIKLGPCAIVICLYSCELILT